MFFSGVLSAAFDRIDPEEEREPPPQPTPVTFPTPKPFETSVWKDDTPPADLRSLFAKVVRPTDISKDHLEGLNVRISSPCSLDDLIPPAPNGTSYFPTLEAPQETSGVASYAEVTKADSIIARKRKDFEDRLTELMVDNELAFCTVTRSVAKGVTPPRLAYMRKFWQGLESMAQYWDTSLDRYYPSTESNTIREASAKRQRLHDETSEGPEISNVEQTDDDNLTADPALDEDEREANFTIATPQSRSVMRYKGRRTSTGREMPDQFRIDTARAFVEATIWPFQTSLVSPRMMPLIQINRLNLPVRQTAAVYRIPRERTKARLGWQEGPLMSLQVRAETDFLNPDGSQIESKVRMDLMREIGGLLQIAQERHRESQTEAKPGEGQWWTTVPRWGGGPGGRMENESDDSDIMQAVDGTTKEKEAKREKEGRRNRNKKTPALLWKELKCGNGYWDPKTDYTAIGKEPGSEYDEVFLLSSLNHHVSIVKMTVHSAYLDCLSSGIVPTLVPQDSEWCSPRLQRSPWFDLFDLDQRIEAFRGLWGVMAYLTRETSSHTEDAVNSPTRSDA